MASLLRGPGIAPGRRRFTRGVLAGGVGLALGLPALGARAATRVPAEQLALFRHGLNITNWLRFPGTKDPDRLRAYMPDSAMAAIRAAGFTFVRFCIQPQVLLRPDGSLEPKLLAVVLDGVERLQRAGLGVIVDAHPESYRPEEHPEHGTALLQFWRAMTPALRRFSPQNTVVEIMNEPVYGDHSAWAKLQVEALKVIRATLPQHTVVLTGADWGSVEGLLKLRPVDDPLVIYSAHDYTPQLLTTQAAWLEDADKAALAQLPFPVTSVPACKAVTAKSNHVKTRELAAWYCDERWGEQQLRGRVRQVGAWGREHGVPVGIFEFGATANLNKAARIGFFRAFAAAAAQEGVSWALWGYGDSMGFSPQAGSPPAVIDPEIVEALGLRG